VHLTLPLIETIQCPFVVVHVWQRVDQPTPDTAGNTAPATTLTDLDTAMDDGRVADFTAINESRMGTSELLSRWHRNTAMQDDLCSAKLIYDYFSAKDCS